MAVARTVARGRPPPPHQPYRHTELFSLIVSSVTSFPPFLGPSAYFGLTTVVSEDCYVCFCFTGTEWPFWPFPGTNPPFHVPDCASKFHVTRPKLFARKMVMSNLTSRAQASLSFSM